MAAGRKKEQRHPLRVHDETIPGGHCPVRAHPKSTTGRSGITIKPHLVPIPNQSGTVYNKKKQQAPVTGDFTYCTLLYL